MATKFIRVRWIQWGEKLPMPADYPYSYKDELPRETNYYFNADRSDEEIEQLLREKLENAWHYKVENIVFHEEHPGLGKVWR